MYMWGRGYCYIQGTIFIGQFQNHQFTGVGERIEEDGSIYRGNFKDYNPIGRIVYVQSDGKVEELNF